MSLILTGNSSTITVDSTNGITFPNATLQASAGVALQVVYGTTYSATTTSSASYTATNLTASITPKFATSKILILVSGVTYGSSIGSQATLKLYRNSSDIGLGVLSQVYGASSTVEGQGNFSLIDAPSSTSSLAYTVYLANTTAVGTAYFPNGSLASIILMEIAG